MPSQAFANVLEPLLSDVGDLIGAHELGRTGKKGRQWRLSGINRSIVVMAVSAWEAYVEHVVVEAVDALRPAGPQTGTWPALNASTRSAAGRFNTPNTQNVRLLIRTALGLQDITQGWSWQRTTPADAVRRLDAALTLRHRIAHGVHPRPTVNHRDAARLRTLFENLASCSDATIQSYVDQHLGVQLNW